MGNRSSRANHINEKARPILSDNDSVNSSSNNVSKERNSSTKIKSRKEKSQKDDQQQSSETDHIIRRPIPQYSSINDGNQNTNILDEETTALLSRYRYYSRLAPHQESQLLMPTHVVPEDYLIRVLVPVAGKQSSLVTIFALWNTMMGTSLLSMPWAIQQAGYICGIFFLVIVAGIMGYTSYRVLKSMDYIVGKTFLEFSDVCKHFLGRYAEILAVVCSLLTLLGGMIVYWILMSNFLYHIVYFIYTHAHGTGNLPAPDNSTSLYKDVVCDSSDNTTSVNASSITDSTFDRIWDETKTVPFFLIIILAPLINFKSPTFFTKFNSLGTISVAYLLVFVAVKVGRWGLNLHLIPGLEFNPSSGPYDSPMFRWTFPALSGVSALAYFVQNCVLAITRNQRCPENNTRDLIIAYILVAGTYIYMGVMFYTGFPLAKSCIEDNLLNNISSTDVMAFVARIGLFFQMTCVFPLLVYILRAQFMHSVFGSQWPSLKHVLLLNVLLVGICLLFAIFLPHIGKILSFVGAFCGLTYAIALPCIVYMAACREAGTLTWTNVISHSLLIILGLANFIAQFVIVG